MSETVKVPYGKGGDNATLLLAAAEELDMEASVVRTTQHGLEVPKEVADKAGVDTYDPDEEFAAEVEEARALAAKQQADDEAAPGSDMTLSRSGLDEQANNVDQGKAREAQVEGDKPAAKKATAKKATAKKAAAKKTASKES